MLRATLTTVGLAFLALATSTSAVELEIPAEKWTSIASVKTPQIYETGFLQTSAHARLRDSCSSPGKVSWTTCEDNGNFQVDLSQTYSIPSPAVKDANVQLHLEGVFTDTANLSGLKIYVEWDKTPLYTNDFPRQKTYGPGDAYVDQITWKIPSFAPNGNYVAWIRLHDNASTPTIYGCVQASFCFTDQK